MRWEGMAINGPILIVGKSPNKFAKRPKKTPSDGWKNDMVTEMIHKADGRKYAREKIELGEKLR